MNLFPLENYLFDCGPPEQVGFFFVSHTVKLPVSGSQYGRHGFLRQYVQFSAASPVLWFFISFQTFVACGILIA